ncbi:LLM class flavin-dependent oxidoreductase [Streptomyces sp. NPDC001591]|uniref:LLM class flavin-dependent oxidoreductase n=1 Tax=Streptomyces sp. NPDC001591 TaxID=3364589 RepID=UPI0036ADD962
MDIYSVTPESVSPHHTFEQDFLTRVRDTSLRCELAGWSGILVPHNLHEVDPWVVAAYIGSVTRTLIPLIAVQPASLPPHTAASMAAAYASLYGRPLYFNLVAGARDDELRQTGDALTHDERYQRMRAYGCILRSLLQGETVTHEGSHYQFRDFKLEPRPDVLSQCKLFVAGSSPASVSVAKEIADVVVTHPAPYEEWEETFLKPLRAAGYQGEFGIRIGLLPRDERTDAWRVAYERFPQTWRSRQETLLKTRSQSAWSRQLAAQAVAEEGVGADGTGGDPYWLGAFRSSRASAPFLVGSHTEVSERLAQYVRAGVGHVLLNGSYENDYGDISRVMKEVQLSAAGTNSQEQR